ncbi:peroxisomal membrane protein PEX16 [Battus philenor]|uniref:peroxisomal membrane protein PEX16 n=1 Tax=Battus philenor TaxID=42288 RepID=UPI0035CFBB51
MFKLYKTWVINNPKILTDVEVVSTWLAYFLAGKLNKSPLVSELVYSTSKLVSLFNDKLIRDACGNGLQHYGLREQIKICLTIAHYCEVFVELAVKKAFGDQGKWTAITSIQLFKCCSALILLYRFKELPIQHPPIPALQRSKFTDSKLTDDKDDSHFVLKRSGRIVRCIEGAPPVALRDWLPIKIKDDKLQSFVDINDLVHAELLHIMKPMIHLASMRMFGTKAWKQWLVALGLDLASFKLYNRHLKELPYEQRLEVSYRKLSFLLYLLRSPMYDNYSKRVIDNLLSSLTKRIPLLSFICGPIIQYLNHWQDIYFYMWAS